MTPFAGIWVPIVTPFRNGEIDFPALARLSRHLASAGVGGLVVCGTTGEAAALNEEEQLAILDAIEQAVPDCPIVMGLAGNNVQDLLQRLDAIQRRPLAGLLVPPPYYIRPSQSGIIAFYEALANATTVPIIAYDIPYRTGIALETDTLHHLAREGWIAAVKDCSGNRVHTMTLIAETTLQILAGEDTELFTALCLGGSGAITAAAHIRPDLFVQLHRFIQAGEWHEARAVFYRLLPLIRLLFREPNPGPVKAALAMTGMLRDELRLPMQSASSLLREQIARELKRLETA